MPTFRLQSLASEIAIGREEIQDCIYHPGAARLLCTLANLAPAPAAGSKCSCQAHSVLFWGSSYHIIHPQGSMDLGNWYPSAEHLLSLCVLCLYTPACLPLAVLAPGKAAVSTSPSASTSCPASNTPSNVCLGAVSSSLVTSTTDCPLNYYCPGGDPAGAGVPQACGSGLVTQTTGNDASTACCEYTAAAS